MLNCMERHLAGGLVKVYDPYITVDMVKNQFAIFIISYTSILSLLQILANSFANAILISRKVFSTYKENVDDMRESPTLQMLNCMERHLAGGLVKVYDPAPQIDKLLPPLQYIRYTIFFLILSSAPLWEQYMVLPMVSRLSYHSSLFS